MKEAGLSEYGVRFGIRKFDFFGEDVSEVNFTFVTYKNSDVKK